MKQLRELIGDIYTQKKRHDEKCGEGKLPRETMEQFMYTYLNQRYGLKQLIIDWASSIISGIKRFSKEDADICLFGKVLRNEIDEEFRWVQHALKETVHTLVKTLVREKHPMKGEGDVKVMIEEVISDRTPLEQPQWLKIIERMYNQEDIQTLEQRIREAATQRMRLEIQNKLQGAASAKGLSAIATPVSPSLVSSSGTSSAKHTSRTRLTREE